MNIVVYQKRNSGSLATETWREMSSVGHMCFETFTTRSYGVGRIG